MKNSDQGSTDADCHTFAYVASPGEMQKRDTLRQYVPGFLHRSAFSYRYPPHLLGMGKRFEDTPQAAQPSVPDMGVGVLPHLV